MARKKVQPTVASGQTSPIRTSQQSLATPDQQTLDNNNMTLGDTEQNQLDNDISFIGNVGNPLRIISEEEQSLSASRIMSPQPTHPTQSMAYQPPFKSKLEKYGGTKSDVRIQTWIKLFELHTMGLNDMQRVQALVYSLKGLALEWFGDEIAGSVLPSWQIVKDRIITRFGFSTASPLIEAQRRYLKREESVEIYYQEKIRLLRQTHLSEFEITQQLTEGLPLSWKLTMVSARPQDASAWINIARMCESHFRQAAQRNQKPVRGAAKTMVSSHDHKSSNKPSAPCRICERLGKKSEFHWHRDCPNRSQMNKPKPTHTEAKTLVTQTNEIENKDNDKDKAVTLCSKLDPILQFIDLSIYINNKPFKAFIDCASTISIISFKSFKTLGVDLNERDQLTIHQVEGSTKSLGSVKVRMTIHDVTHTVTLHVLDNFRYPVLLGLDIGETFGLRVDLKYRKASLPSPDRHSITLCMEREQKGKLTQLLRDHKDVFSQNETDIGRITVAKHRITTVTHPPIQLRAYRRPQSEYDEISRQIKELKEKNLIRDSESPWAFPITLVSKKDGGKRLCIDYRRLNSITIDDKMPLPRITEVIDRLSGCKFFTTLDVAWGYWHIEMDPESIDKTAFITHEGHYEWLVLPFGLKNAPATFQRILQKVLGKLLYKGAINYLDDIIIYSKTFEEHLQLLQQVFALLKQHNIKLKLSKCHFAQTEVQYLGYIIGTDGIKPSPEKITAVQKFPTPLNIRDVRRFLGLANYYRRFINQFSIITKPLTNLLKKETKFYWNNEHEIAFQTIKNILIKEPVLGIYDNEKECTLYTDASKIGIGATLTQKDDKGTEHPIAYFSKSLNEHQGNYTAFELECLAVVEAVEHFEVYLSKPFKVITDHSALRWLLTYKKPKGRLFRWSVKLSTLTYELIHRAGKNQQHVDALSRAPVTLHLEAEELKTHQQKSDMSYVKYPVDHNNITMVRVAGQLKAVVPESLRHKLFSYFHDEHSHPGRNKTAKLISRFYWWPSMIEDIKAYVTSCKTCQMVKPIQKPTIGQMILPSADLQPGQLVGLDTIVLGPAAGSTRHKYIQVFIDHFSRYVWAFPTASNTSSAITTLIDKLIHSGIQIKTILTDCHKNFTSKTMADCLKRHHIKHIQSTPYHPQTNGIVERINGTLMTKVRAAIQDNPKRKWNTLLPKIINDYNHTPHDVTGYAPSYLFFGTERTPTFIQSSGNLQEARQKAIQRTKDAQAKRKERHDAHHGQATFQIGDRVIRQTAPNHPSLNKTAPKFTGPYYIINKITDVTYDISESLTGTTVRAHSSQLRPFVARQQTQ